MDDATGYFASGTTYQWVMWTGDISNMFDEISHAEILIAVTWALNNMAACMVWQEECGPILSSKAQ